MPGVCKQCLMADTWFLELYKSAFSVLLGAGPASPGSEFLELDDVYQPALSVSVALLGGKHVVPKVYHHPGGFDDLWHMYQVMTPLEERVSKPRLKLGRVYAESLTNLRPIPQC